VPRVRLEKRGGWRRSTKTWRSEVAKGESLAATRQFFRPWFNAN